MKLFATMILIIASVSTLAYERSRVVTSYSTIAMGPGILTYNQLCLNDANQLETIKPKEICVKYSRMGGGDNDRRTCIEKESRIFTADLEYTKRVCVRRRGRSNGDHRCQRWENQVAYHNTYYTKTVREQRWSGNRSDGGWDFPGKVISTQRIDVPVCD